jgi:hypothetical protein
MFLLVVVVVVPPVYSTNSLIPEGEVPLILLPHDVSKVDFLLVCDKVCRTVLLTLV